MTARASEFVKSATTATSVEQSQAQIIAMLRRYGASGFGFRTEGATVLVTFYMPRHGGGTPHEVAIPIDVGRVHAKLDTPAVRAAQRAKKKAINAEQAERVAWRVLYLWIDAALAAVSIGAQTIEDAFLAHMVVESRHGTRARVADHMAPALASGADYMPTALIGEGGAR
jgi:hypothetical protein